jgi:hypothetical protein
VQTLKFFTIYNKINRYSYVARRGEERSNTTVFLK